MLVRFPSWVLWFELLLLLTLEGCRGVNTPSEADNAPRVAPGGWIRYAKGFQVRDTLGMRLVDVMDPLGESDATYHYALIPRGEPREGVPAGYQAIEVPVQKAICMTALQMSNFIKLQQTERIVGINSTRFLFNARIKRQLEEQRTHRVGIEGNFDTELLLSLAPDIILVSPFKRGGFEALRNLGIPLVTFLGYKESSPLGQAEWLKFTAMLLGCEEEATRVFDSIANEYERLQALVDTVKRRPVVMSGQLHGGNWYVVGGRSYLANLFRDAGATYFLSDDSESGGFYVDFERVYAAGSNADYWRMVNNHPGEYSYTILGKTDARYRDFAAFKSRHVIYCNLTQKPFYELTPVEPEVVLADLIKIFHPSLLPDWQPVYYELLSRE